MLQEAPVAVSAALPAYGGPSGRSSLLGWQDRRCPFREYFKLTASGTYELVVRMGNQDLSVLAFDALATESGDAFTPGKTCRLTGPRDNLAYLYARDGNPNALLHVAGWVADREFGPNREDKWVTVQITRGGTALCKSVVFVHAPHWSRYRFDPTRGTTNAECTTADIVKADGDHVLEFRNPTKLLRTFPFKVVGKQIQRMPRNTIEFLATNWDGIPAKLVNSDMEMQELFWFEVSRER